MTQRSSDSCDFLIGVDGGGSGTRAVVARPDGSRLGAGRAGPSALGQGVPQAWRHVEQAVRDAFRAAGEPLPAWRRCALVAALSGVSHEPWRRAFLAADPGLGLLDAETDSFAMLLGAHAGAPGVIVVAGTGSIAEALHTDGRRSTVGGWGFPVGDEGSGAWLGLQAMRHAQAAMDGRAAAGELAQRIWSHCGADRDALQTWCGHAGQFAYAQLARAVFECQVSDPVATALLEGAATALAELARAIDPRGQLPLAVSGSIGERLASRFDAALRARLVPVREDAAQGALRLARQLAQEALEETA
jgi:glucosamine kinase